MLYVQHDQIKQSRLRFVFDDKVVSLDLGADATMGDIASALLAFSPLEYGTPVAIDVTLGGLWFGSGMQRSVVIH
jgi:hypothetical protein